MLRRAVMLLLLLLCVLMYTERGRLLYGPAKDRERERTIGDPRTARETRALRPPT